MIPNLPTTKPFRELKHFETTETTSHDGPMPTAGRWDLRKAVWPHIAERIFLAIYFVEVVLRAFADGSPRVTQSLT